MSEQNEKVSALTNSITWEIRLAAELACVREEEAKRPWWKFWCSPVPLLLAQARAAMAKATYDFVKALEEQKKLVKEFDK